MTTNLLPLLVIGFLVGFRHAFEPDHLAAVTTLATRQGTLRDAARLGAAWGVGHTVAVGAVALLLIGLDWRLSPRVAAAAELLVASLLIGLGITVLVRFARRHRTELGAAHAAAHARGVAHAHEPPIRDARRSLGFGLAHGMAGSGAVVALLLATAATRAAQTAYFAAFAAGTIIGMLAVSGAVAALSRLAATSGPRWAARLHLGSAAASIAVGVLLAVDSSAHLF